VVGSAPSEIDGPFQASNDGARCKNYDANGPSINSGADWPQFGGSQFTKIERNTGNQNEIIQESNITQNMNIYFADPNQDAAKIPSYVSDPLLHEEIIPIQPNPGSIRSGTSFIMVPSKMRESNPINPLNNENLGKVEYAFEGKEKKEKFSDWSIPENISKSALRVQAELIHKTTPKSNQLDKESSSIVPREPVRVHRPTSLCQKFPNMVQSSE
jgi:hypothetical protein